MRDVNALLAEAEEQLAAVRSIYEASLRAKNASAKLQIRIKNVLDNQRSALEYAAHSITERFGRANSRSYYPLAGSAIEFSRLLKLQMKGVAEARPDIAAVIERHQPYQPDHDWLGHLRTLVNENKHRRLTPQTRQQGVEFEGGPGGGYMGTAAGGIKFGPGGKLRIPEGAAFTIEFPGPGPIQGHNLMQAVYVDWLFADPHLSALQTLERIQQRLPAAIADIFQVADQNIPGGA